MFKTLIRKINNWFNRHYRVAPIIPKTDAFNLNEEGIQNSGSNESLETKSDESSISSGIESFEEKIEQTELKEIAELKKLLAKYNNSFNPSINNKLTHAELAELEEEVLVKIGKAKENLEKHPELLSKFNDFLKIEFMQKPLSINLVDYYIEILVNKQICEEKNLKATFLSMEKVLKASPNSKGIEKFYKAVINTGINKSLKASSHIESPFLQVFYKHQVKYQADPVPEIKVIPPPQP